MLLARGRSPRKKTAYQDTSCPIVLQNLLDSNSTQGILVTSAISETRPPRELWRKQLQEEGISFGSVNFTVSKLGLTSDALLAVLGIRRAREYTDPGQHLGRLTRRQIASALQRLPHSSWHGFGYLHKVIRSRLWTDTELDRIPSMCTRLSRRVGFMNEQVGQAAHYLNRNLRRKDHAKRTLVPQPTMPIRKG